MTSITYINPERSLPDLLKDLSARHGLRVEEIYRMARRLVSNLSDQLPFEHRIGTHEFNHWDHSPPDPYSDCDLAVAWSYAQEDAKRNAQLLQSGDKLTLRTALHIFRNTIQWARFWSIRHPHAEDRERFAEELEAAQAQLEDLEAKAWATNNCEAVETLSDLNLIEPKE